jgi:predicted DNA-binding transcriptional regulator YafY
MEAAAPMNRTERLAALLLLLQSRRGNGRLLTAQEVADHFGTSRRTAIRDMAALSAMGVPVESADGAHGGYSLPEDFAPAPLPLDTREAMLLLLALSGIERMAAAPFGDARATLAAKLRALLAPRQLGAADALLGKVALAPPESRALPAPHLDRLLAAAQTGRWVSARYRKEGDGAASDLTLLPVRLYAHGGLWYCEAHAHERGGERRTYRADRFESVMPCDPPPGAAPCEPADYAAPDHPELRATLTPRGVAVVEREPHVGGRVTRLPDGSGTVAFRFPPGEMDWWAGYFLRLGTDADVSAPPELRARIRDGAREILARYDGER